MAAITVVPANVLALAGAKTKQDPCGAAAIVAGQPVYRDEGVMKLSRANALGTAVCDGISMAAASPGQPLVYLVFGDYNPGVAVTLGTLYVVGPAAAGDTAPYSDLSSGHYPCNIGYAVTTSQIHFAVNAAGVAKP